MQRLQHKHYIWINSAMNGSSLIICDLVQSSSSSSIAMPRSFASSPLSYAATVSEINLLMSFHTMIARRTFLLIVWHSRQAPTWTHVKLLAVTNTIKTVQLSIATTIYGSYACNKHQNTCNYIILNRMNSQWQTCTTMPL